MKKLFHRVAGADLTRNSILVLAAILLGNVFNYAYYLLMGRTLSVRDYGAVMSLVSAALLVLGVGTVIQTVVAKLAADLRAGADESRMAAFARAIVRVSIVTAALIFAAALLASRPLALYLQLDRSEPVIVAGAAAAIGFVTLFQRGLFQGFGTFKSFAVSSSLDGAKALVIFPLAHAFGAIGALFAFLAGTLTTMTYGAVALRRRFFFVRDAAALDFRRLVRSAGATGIASISIVVLMFYDVVLAKHYVSPAAAGLYSAAALGGRAVLAVCSFLPTILLPDVALRSASGRPHRHVLGAALGIALSIVGVALAACALRAKLVLAILAGHAFEGAAPLLLPYVASSSGLALANLLAMYAIARHNFGFIPYVVVIAISEITAVALRHASPMEIVQDILAGHLAICLAMGIWVALSLLRTPAAAPSAAVGGEDFRVGLPKPPRL